MSKIGKKSVLIPEGVTIISDNSSVTIKGPKARDNYTSQEID
jgi:ribosomal protein L6P/L9E